MRINLQIAPSTRTPEHGLQQLLNAADQISNRFAEQQHDVDLLGQLMQKHSKPSGSCKHQHDDCQLTEDGSIGEATPRAKDPSLVKFAAPACRPHGMVQVRVASLRRF